MAAVEEKRVKLSDEERSRIRWSSTKRGFVGLIEFHRGPRGGRFRSVRSRAAVTREEAQRFLDEAAARYRTPIRQLTLREVDALGRILKEEVV